ncbi:MAG: AraC family transcriptional regulator [Spirochaetia bacterium]|jgi:AraC-like DNA-binding protein|nr:AraC family transcriptional regulator [Spirochaetia bacterium]MCH3918842.1 AraC family transcriptional regulator [Spirochaetia bacterium]
MKWYSMQLDSQPMAKLSANSECKAYQLSNETGNGVMTIYEVLPGILLFYNDYHMAYFHSKLHTTDNLFCIDYCREGRLEYHVGEKTLSYVEADDLKFDRRVRHTGLFAFPLSHYHGITVSIKLPLAAEFFNEKLPEFSIDLYSLQQKFCSDSNPMVIHGLPEITHIFKELYDVPTSIRRSYFKIKVIELLLCLRALELPSNQEERPYFYKSQVEKIKAMFTLVTKHPEQHYTMKELSEQFDIPLTPMKNCFKCVYGNPISTYMRVYRMNRAAEFLRQDKDSSVAEIAGRVGYDSPSKFAAAFKKIMGKTPLEYRKNSFSAK